MRETPAGVRGELLQIAAVAVVVAAATGCGKSEKVVGGSASVAMSTAPDYLDPQLAYLDGGGRGRLDRVHTAAHL